MTKANFGVVGMAVMGRNLALNIESRGYTVAIYNRSKEKTEDVIACHPEKNFVPSYDIESFVNSIEKPRRIMLMVQAGPGTDATIQALLPHLDKGDILIDGGNTFYKDTIRRNEELANSGINFIGTGVSGGEKGALEGPSIMPGGQKEAYELVADVLEEISAKAPEDGKPCVTYIGPDGAGHYVKMVHNGIEYGDMQLIAESYDLVTDSPTKRIYEAVKRIPKGKVATYGKVAEMAGNKKMSRAVGNALHKNPDPDNIPCFRVVNSKGDLAPEFAFGGMGEQRKLLEAEGIEVKDNKVDLSKYGLE
mgnify:CR=1 FL=1